LRLHKQRDKTLDFTLLNRSQMLKHTSTALIVIHFTVSIASLDGKAIQIHAAHGVHSIAN
jgi:hypothetical protein